MTPKFSGPFIKSFKVTKLLHNFSGVLNQLLLFWNPIWKGGFGIRTGSKSARPREPRGGDVFSLAYP